MKTATVLRINGKHFVVSLIVVIQFSGVLIKMHYKNEWNLVYKSVKTGVKIGNASWHNSNSKLTNQHTHTALVLVHIQFNAAAAVVHLHIATAASVSPLFPFFLLPKFWHVSLVCMCAFSFSLPPLQLWLCVQCGYC